MGVEESIVAGAGAWAVLGLLMLVVLAGCAMQRVGSGKGGGIAVSSAAFVQGRPVPARYACTGEDLSPAVRWTGAPAGTQSFVVVLEDPDAPGGVFTHWIVYGIPPDQQELPEGLPAEPVVAGGILQGSNDFGSVGYRGPCPPRGPAHRYVLRVYALDGMPNLAAGADRIALDRVISGHILATGDTSAAFSR
jgi:Raf kinase inhibitor-like YbhB/YbcL family protein